MTASSGQVISSPGRPWSAPAPDDARLLIGREGPDPERLAGEDGAAVPAVVEGVRPGQCDARLHPRVAAGHPGRVIPAEAHAPDPDPVRVDPSSGTSTWSMMAAPGTSQSPGMASRIRLALPGPSTLKVAIPRSRNRSSVLRSLPWPSQARIMIMTGWGPGPAGWRSTPIIRNPSNGSRPGGRADPGRAARRSGSHARPCAALIWSSHQRTGTWQSGSRRRLDRCSPAEIVRPAFSAPGRAARARRRPRSRPSTTRPRGQIRVIRRSPPRSRRWW